MKHRQVVAALERMHRSDERALDAWLSDLCADLYELLDEGACLASTILDFDRVHFAHMHSAAPNAAVGLLGRSS